MIAIQSKIHIEGIGGMPIFSFLINPNDRAYQSWWPGTHLKFHNLRRTPGNIGNVVYMDEYVGKRRVRLTGIVTEAQPGKKTPGSSNGSFGCQSGYWWNLRTTGKVSLSLIRLERALAASAASWMAFSASTSQTGLPER